MRVCLRVCGRQGAKHATCHASQAARNLRHQLENTLPRSTIPALALQRCGISLHSLRMPAILVLIISLHVVCVTKADDGGAIAVALL